MEEGALDRPASGVIDPAAIHFERLRKDYLAEVIAIEHEAYPDPWTQGMFQQEMRNETSHFYLAIHGGEVVAYGGFWMILDEVHITKVTVARPWRGQGIGRYFMNYLETRGLDAGGTVIRLEVRESNVAARRLYQRFGFEEVGLRKNYYAVSPEHAVIMVKHLLGTPPGEGVEFFRS